MVAHKNKVRVMAMKYKNFNIWCNQRVCDGCWGMNEAIFCINIIQQIQRQPFWKRERKWK